MEQVRAAHAFSPHLYYLCYALEGQWDGDVRRRITIDKSRPGMSFLEVRDGSTWRLPTQHEAQGMPSFYYLKPRTGALQETFDPANENNIFSLIKDWMPPELSREGDLHKLMRGYQHNATNLAAYAAFFEN